MGDKSDELLMPWAQRLSEGITALHKIISSDGAWSYNALGAAYPDWAFASAQRYFHGAVPARARAAGAMAAWRQGSMVGPLHQPQGFYFTVGKALKAVGGQASSYRFFMLSPGPPPGAAGPDHYGLNDVTESARACSYLLIRTHIACIKTMLILGVAFLASSQ